MQRIYIQYRKRNNCKRLFMSTEIVEHDIQSNEFLFIVIRTIKFHNRIFSSKTDNILIKYKYTLSYELVRV